MLPTSTDVLFSTSSKISSDSMVECELEGEDDWVVVKKQKITILVPPPSPIHPQSTSPEETEGRIIKRSSGARKKRRHGFVKDDKQKELCATPDPVNSALAYGIVIGSRAQEAVCNPVASPKKFGDSSLTRANGNGNGTGTAVHRKLINLLPIGALNVVNQRLRAMNLERELEGLGGLKKWLVSRGLHRFVKVFEREKVTNYQLVRLTMGMLKDMGTDAVGPRRKLIHAIDRLCHPCYSKSLQ